MSQGSSLPALSDEDGRLILEYAEDRARSRLKGLPGEWGEASSYAAVYAVRYALRYDPSRGVPWPKWLRYLADAGVRRYLQDTSAGRWRGYVALDRSYRPDGDPLSTLLEAEGADPEAAADASDLFRRITRRLRVRARRMVEMRVAGAGLQEIGEEMGCCRATVIDVLAAARRKMWRTFRRLGSKTRKNNVGRSRKELVRAAAKGRGVHSQERRKDRQVSGWPDLPAAQGRALAHLAAVPHSSTPEIAAALGVKITTCRNALAALKKEGRVERCGGGGLGGDALYRITEKSLRERGGV